MKNIIRKLRELMAKKPGLALLAAGLFASAVFFATPAGAQVVTSSGVWYRNASAMLLNPSTLTVGSSTSPIAALYTSLVTATTSSSNAVLVTGTKGSAGNFQIYVTKAGSDSNDCLSASTPCLTVQKALDVASSGSFPGQVSISVGAGTYTENLDVGPVLARGEYSFGDNQVIEITGDETTPGNVVLTSSSSRTMDVWYTAVSLRGVTLTSTGNQSCISAFNARVYTRNVAFTNCGTLVSVSFLAVFEARGSTAGTTWTQNSSGTTMLSSGSAALIQFDSTAFTLVGGAANTSMVATSTGGRFSPVAGFTFTGNSGTTTTAINATSNSRISISGNISISNVDAATASSYGGAAIRLVEGASLSYSGGLSQTFTNCTTAYRLAKNAWIVATNSTGMTTTYTSVTNYAILDNSALIDVSDMLDIPATGFVWDAGSATGLTTSFARQFKPGTATAAANNLTLPTDGNVTHITGSTQVNLINTTSLFSDYQVLIFDSTPTIKSGQTSSGANKQIKLKNGVDMVAKADTRLVLWYDRTNSVWIEQSRTVADGNLESISAANDLPTTPTADFFLITGNTTINGASTVGAYTGRKITLIFNDALTLKNNTAPSAGFAKIRTQNSADLEIKGGEKIDIVFDGTDWNQINYFNSPGTCSTTITTVGGGGTVPQYTTNTCRTERIGNRVFVDYFFTGDGGNEGAGATDQLQVALPWTADANHPSDNFGVVGYGNNDTATENWALLGEIDAGGTTIKLSRFASGGAAPSGFFAGNQSNTSRSFRLHFDYYAQ